MFDLNLSMKKFSWKKSQMHCSFNVVMTLCIKKMRVPSIMVKKDCTFNFFENINKLRSS